MKTVLFTLGLFLGSSAQAATVHVIDLAPTTEISSFSTIDLKSELSRLGVSTYGQRLRSVKLWAKAPPYAWGSTKVSLEVGWDAVDRARIEKGYDYESDDPYTFSLVGLVNRADPLESSDFDDWDLTFTGSAKVARIEVMLAGKPQLSWAQVESFQPQAGKFERLSWNIGSHIGPVTEIKVLVDKRAVEIRKFVVEYQDGSKKRLQNLEGIIDQKDAESEDLGGRKAIRRISVEIKTLPNQGGRARVDLLLQHYSPIE